MVDVVVAVPTFRRPQSLARLLAALERLETAARLAVIVADNDSEKHEGYDLCLAMRESYRWPLEPVIATERGIAQVRNVLVDRALAHPQAKFIAMLDDDEWPSPQWLDAFLRVQAETGADVLEGSILFERNGENWADGFDGLSSMRRPTGAVDMLEGAGNILIARRCVEDRDHDWFDTAFGLTGGEDRDFFERVKRAGCRFAWADEALAFTVVPVSRRSLRWTLARAYSIGNAEMRVFLKHRPVAARRFAEYAKIAAAILACPILSLLLIANAHRAADALRRFCRNAGKASALLGLRHDQYAVIHGD